MSFSPLSMKDCGVNRLTLEVSEVDRQMYLDIIEDNGCCSWLVRFWNIARALISFAQYLLFYSVFDVHQAEVSS